jgi:ubiquinone biosynthesis protein
MKPFDLLSHAGRAKTILTVLVRHGFADLVDQLDLPAGFWHRLLTPPGPSRSTAERARLAAEELGTSFVKLGQFLSMRPDVLPEPFILELRKLQDSVAPLPFDQMRPVLVAELGRELSEVFSEFDESPAACASLAQVYFAKLRDGGHEVAVKVQKPDLRRTVEIDLGLAAWLAGQLHQRVEALRPFDLPAVVATAREGLLLELDFLHEARNQAFFNTTNPHPEQVFAPAVHPEYSTDRVLVMERIHGRPAAQADLNAAQRRVVAAHGAQSIMRQVLVAGFFHADPHNGNLLVTPDGRLCLLDWGLAGHLTRRLRHALADFWAAAAAHDAERVVQIAATLAEPGVAPDYRSMEREVSLVLHEELNFAIGRQELGRAMLQLLHIFGRQGIPLSRDYSLVAKAILSIEEVGRSLDPQFDLKAHLGPVSRELQQERGSPRAVLRRTRETLRDTLASLQGLPAGIQRLVRRLEHDDLTFNLQHRGLEDHDDAMKIAANRITLGVIIGSLIIGSSLIITTGTKPLLFGYPVLGTVGFLLSALLGFYVIWDIIRHGRHK